MARFKTGEHKTTLADAISGAFSDVTDLASEMREWADNMEERLSHTEKYERVSECADTLEQNQDEPTVVNGLGDIEVTYSVMQHKQLPRWARLDNAKAAVQACIDALSDDAVKDATKLADDCDSLADALQSALDEWEGVEFPGMYG